MTRARTAASVVSAAIALAACSEGDLLVSPAPRAASAGASGKAGAATTGGAGAGGTSAGAAPSASTAGSAGKPGVRSVIVRDPLGRLDAGNLLWDGDFEWSGPFVSQYGWAKTSTTGKAFGGEPPDVVAGFSCRSGIKCALLGEAGIGGIAVAPATPGTWASVWVKVPEPAACSDVVVRLEGCFFDAVGWPALPPVSATKDAGWCRYVGVRPTVPAPCLFVAKPKGASGDFLVDDAQVTAEPKDTKALSLTKLDATEAARLEVAALQGAMRDARMRLPPDVQKPSGP